MLMFRAMLVYAPLRSWIGAVVATITMLAMPADKATATEFTITDVERIQQLGAEKKCGEAWDVLWNAALEGSPIATYMLSMALVTGLHPPMPLPRKDAYAPTGDMLKQPWGHLYVSVVFATDVRQMPKDNLDPLYDGDRQDTLDAILIDREGFKELMQPDTYTEYEAEECLSEHPPNKCFDPKGWGLPILSLTDWDGQLEEYKAKGFKAVCLPPRP